MAVAGALPETAEQRNCPRAGFASPQSGLILASCSPTASPLRLVREIAGQRRIKRWFGISIAALIGAFVRCCSDDGTAPRGNPRRRILRTRATLGDADHPDGRASRCPLANRAEGYSEKFRKKSRIGTAVRSPIPLRNWRI